MKGKTLTVIWPRDLLLPIIDVEIKQLLQYLTRNNSWYNCFETRIKVEGILIKLNNSKLWKSVLKRHPEITNDYITNLIIEVATFRGLVTSYKGLQIALEENSNESSL